MSDGNRSRSGGRSLQAFLHWWAAELRALLPVSIRRMFGLTQERLILHLAGDELELRRQLDADMPAARVARVDLAASNAAARRLLDQLKRVPPQGLVLRLPPGSALRKTLSLPTATLDNLREVLGFEMDRLTPFKAEDVYYDARVLEVDDKAQQARIALTVVPRTVGDAALQRLRAAGVHPRCMDIDDADAEGTGLNLLPQNQHGDGRGRSAILDSVLAVVIVALVAAIVALPLMRKQAQNRELAAAVRKARQEAEATNERSREAEALVEQSRFLDNRRRASPGALPLIEELSDITPDDTWVSRLSIDGTQLTLQGESGSATALIGLYENSPMLANVRFRAQLTKNAATSRDRFDIGCDIVNAGAGAP
jgi:general secretion pathway protein L